MQVVLLLLFLSIGPITGRTFSFCQLFISGGSCQSECQFEAVHKWGVDFYLCPQMHGTNKCCIPLDHPLVQLFLKRSNKSKVSSTTKTPSTTTTSTTSTEATTTTPTSPTTQQVSISTESVDIQSEKRCGVSRVKSRVRRVVGGKSAPPGAWPWQVAIRTYTGHYVCGGVLLTSQWVITAAHCFKESENSTRFLRVYIGDQIMSYDQDETHKVFKIEQIIEHEKFERTVNLSMREELGNSVNMLRHVHDIALVKLETSVNFTDDVEPICLPELDGDLDRQDCWVTGWGETGDTGKEPVKNLQEVRGRMVDSDACAESWGTNFTNDVICFSSEGKGPCKGDSGSGMACRHTDGRFHLTGIVSWGRDDCIHDDHPSVLTNVAEYRDWIDGHLMIDN